MAKKTSTKPMDPAEALANMETPQVKWKVIAQVVAAFGVLWVTAFMVVPWVGYWVLGIVGALSLGGIGFGLYIWRLTSRSRAIVDIMKGATDEAGRKRAMEQLESAGSKDAMKVLARAQLLAQTDAQGALQLLESIEVKKAPAVLQDDVRSQLAMLYLRANRIRDARIVADEMRLDRQPNPKAKALYAAIMAETFARTGSADEAKKLMETYDPAEGDYAEAQAMLFRAQVFTYFALKKRGLARKAMQQLAQVEPNMLAGFVQKGNQPEVMQMAKPILAASGFAPKMKVRRGP